MLDHTDVERRLAVVARDHALVDRTDVRGADVAQAHREAADVRDNDVVELLRRLEVGLGNDGEFACARFDPAGGNLGVLAADRVLDVLHRQLVAGEPVAIEIDAHRDLPFAEDSDVRCARQHRQARLHVALHVIGRLEHGASARLHRDVNHRKRIGFDFRDHRLVDGIGQLRAHAGNLVAHVGRRGIGIALQCEPNVDLTALGAALRRHDFDAFDTGERILERLGDLRFDDFGRRAAIGRDDAHHRLVDPRIFAHREARVRNHPDEHDDQRQHGGQHRPLNADFG